MGDATTMKLSMLYLLGVPGAGKTTALKLALQDANIHARYPQPILHTRHVWVLGDIHDAQTPEFRVFELGGDRGGGFGGTDALPMNAQPKVLEWLKQEKPARVIAEGDRLGNAKFFNAVLEMGYDLTLVHLNVPPEQADARRRIRADELGKVPQNEAWVRGRMTKVRNLFWQYQTLVTEIDGTMVPRDIAAAIRHLPFFSQLEERRAYDA